jgi:frataxin-like iron-binding protein CyaY
MLKNNMENVSKREELIKKIVNDNIKILNAIAELDKETEREGRLSLNLGEKAEVMVNTSITVQEIFAGSQNAGT